MGDRHANPNDRIDLSVLAESYGETLGTLYPVAHVYAPKNSAGNVVEVSGSPFTLTHFGNNLYGLEGAFQADVSSGTYKVVYIFYTDASHTTKSSQIGETHETITISIQSTTGLGSSGGSGDFYYDDKLIRRLINQLEKKINKLQKDFDAGLKIEVPIDGAEIIEAINSKTFSYGEILEAITSKTFDNSQIITAIKNKTFDNSKILKAIDDKKFDEKNILSSIKDKHGKTILAIKKNRSTTIKHKFDKSQIIPITKTVADTNFKLTNDMDRMKIDLTNTLELNNKEVVDIFNNKLEKDRETTNNLINSLNESIRKKLKFALFELKSLVLKNWKSKQDIKVTLKKDEW